MLKGELNAAEDRIDFLATIDAYIRHYTDLAALGMSGKTELEIRLIEKARTRFVKAYGADDVRAGHRSLSPDCRIVRP